MSRTNWTCLSAVIFGFVLFLYGANFFDAIVGWIGVYLFFGGVLVYLIRYIYDEWTKKGEVHKT